ncbi:septum formation inhibitor Maf [Mycolicibacterium moriokaense]|jgi:septum formation protein|uniref:Maf family protein n=1 Tax=Mycolicibacterium moriokaense TaxID=39691 RepID=UPI0009F1BE29|nr:nucleoside triphosphate pyrophosphatase [Mycolicibacterium moriokaense]MCV7037246.1 septum formation inhibitor Maf [Mycolicibacterium moriokaense]ORB20987.1 septum formation inhibitor Maf [Mycolicibacterium moriokaense]
MTRFVLASASPGRRKVLRQAGIDPLVIVSGVDEDAVMATLDPSATPTEVTTALALAKAEAVVSLLDAAVAADCVVIGCDSMLYRDGQLRGKPATADDARLAWQEMAGTSGELYTGHSVIRLQDNDITWRAADATVTTVTFGHPSSADLDAYVRSGEPMAVAGGFTLDGLGGWFVDAVDGDPSSVIGIGLPLIRRLLDAKGMSVADLWSANPVT